MSLPEIHVDFVSDVSCPWCAIGLQAFRQAVAQLEGELKVVWQCQPFELNPDMPPGGQNADEHLSQKYGSSVAQVHERRAQIRDRAAQLGLTFTLNERSRVYNTFDAHRLLHWAGLPEQPDGAQMALKVALLDAYFSRGLNPSDPQVLADLAQESGLNADEAAGVLGDEQAFADDVRQAEAFWQAQGIRSVPAVVLDRRYLISGGQPVEVFVQALRERAAAQND